jgi:hypothetical protein
MLLVTAVQASFDSLGATRCQFRSSVLLNHRWQRGQTAPLPSPPTRWSFAAWRFCSSLPLGRLFLDAQLMRSSSAASRREGPSR